MVEAIHVYLDSDAEDSEPGDMTWTEMGLLAPLQKIDPDFGGTADRVRYRPSTRLLIVKDFKYGKGLYVEIVSNKQIMIYALGVLLEMRANKLPVDLIRIDVVQPRYEGREPVRSWSFRAVELLDYIADLKEAANASRQPDAKLEAGDHCKFCPAAGICPVLREHQTSLMAAQVDALPVSPEVISQALKSVPLVKARIKALEELAYSAACRGIEIPGFKLVDKRPTRKWKKEGDAIMWAQARGLDPFDPRTVRSPAQMENLIPGGRKKAEREAKDAALKELAALIESPSSGTTLVPITDERAPAERKMATADDFEAGSPSEPVAGTAITRLF